MTMIKYEEEFARDLEISNTLKQEILERVKSLYENSKNRRVNLPKVSDKIADLLKLFLLTKNGDWYVFHGFAGSDVGKSVAAAHRVVMVARISARYDANGVYTEMRHGKAGGAKSKK